MLDYIIYFYIEKNREIPASCAESSEPSRSPIVPMTAVVIAALSSRVNVDDDASFSNSSGASWNASRVVEGGLGSRYV